MRSCSSEWKPPLVAGRALITEFLKECPSNLLPALRRPCELDLNNRVPVA